MRKRYAPTPSYSTRSLANPLSSALHLARRHSFSSMQVLSVGTVVGNRTWHSEGKSKVGSGDGGSIGRLRFGDGLGEWAYGVWWGIVDVWWESVGQVWRSWLDYWRWFVVIVARTLRDGVAFRGIARWRARRGKQASAFGSGWRTTCSRASGKGEVC